jgi:hypothetical protein
LQCFQVLVAVLQYPARKETQTGMSFIFVILLFSLSAVALIFIHRGLPGSARDMGWKMSGVWSNPSNLHVLLHANGARMRGHIVSSLKDNDTLADSSLVVKELAVRPLWQWSDGTFVEPGSREEHRVRIRLTGSRTLRVKFPDDQKTEEWKLIDPM